MKTISLFKAFLALMTMLGFLAIAPTTAQADPHLSLIHI